MHSNLISDSVLITLDSIVCGAMTCVDCIVFLAIEALASKLVKETTTLNNGGRLFWDWWRAKLQTTAQNPML